MRALPISRVLPRRPLLAVIGFGVPILAGSIIRAPTASAAATVSVLYAASLVNLVERSIGPAFDEASGDRFQGYAGGSNLLANQIKGKLRQGDVFVSANPKVNANLMGSANGDWVSWYITFAQSPLVIGYNAASRFAEDFKTKPWYQVLMEPGIRIGRTDPKLDPKGQLTLDLMKAAGTTYNIPDLSQRVLGAPENPAQVLPEETLIGRLQSGQLDAGFFYSTETSDAKILAVTLPAAITPKAIYTITILRDAPDPEGADQFVSFLLGPKGQGLMRAHGLDVQKFTLTGAAGSVPAIIRSLVSNSK
jgi:molybdate/tungstate transport system substrate-binding protein